MQQDWKTCARTKARQPPIQSELTKKLKLSNILFKCYYNTSSCSKIVCQTLISAKKKKGNFFRRSLAIATGFAEEPIQPIVQFIHFLESLITSRRFVVTDSSRLFCLPSDLFHFFKMAVRDIIKVYEKTVSEAEQQVTPVKKGASASLHQRAPSGPRFVVTASPQLSSDPEPSPIRSTSIQLRAGAQNGSAFAPQFHPHSCFATPFQD